MSRWFRHYAGMMRDDKLVSVAIRTRQSVERVVWVWGAILESAAEIDDEGRYALDAAEAAYFLRADEADVDAIVAGLEAAGRVSEGVVVKWGVRQFQSDRSAERQRRYRDKLKRDGDGQSSSSPAVIKRNGDAAITSPLQPSDAPEAETETDTKQLAQHPTTAREPAAAPRSRVDYDRIESLCRQAAGVDGSPSPSLKNLAPILAFLDKGYDLDRDILPVLKAKRAAGKQGRSWGYYSAAIEDSVRAVAAISPRPPTVGAAPLSREDEWLQRLDFLAEKGQWPEAIWGAPPGRQFCEIPADFIAKHRPNLSSRYRREEVA